MKSNFKYGSYRIKIKNIREETQNGFVKSKCPNNKFRASNGKVKKKKWRSFIIIFMSQYKIFTWIHGDEQIRSPVFKFVSL